jgi:hypothetical protein
MNRGFYEKSSLNYCVPRFSTDASKQLYCGQSVTYINLQLAYFLGFSEVYLIGMDFSYEIPDSHKRTGDVLLSDTDDTNHFHKDYFGKGKTWKDPKIDRVGLNYKMAKLAFEGTGRKIFNATVGGKLEIFDRVDYHNLLANKVANCDISFSEANKLALNKDYISALRGYKTLIEHEGKWLYKRAFFNCYSIARDNGIEIPDEQVQYARSIL